MKAKADPFSKCETAWKKAACDFLADCASAFKTAIVAGAVLVVYEVLSDYGVTSYFGIHTISTAIFQTWFGMYDIDSGDEACRMADGDYRRAVFLRKAAETRAALQCK